jgi:hypothetical protein
MKVPLVVLLVATAVCHCFAVKIPDWIRPVIDGPAKVAENINFVFTLVMRFDSED